MARRANLELWSVDECHFQQHGSRCRMWVPPEDQDPILLHAPTRKSVACFGAVHLRTGQFVRRMCKVFNALTFQRFLTQLVARFFSPVTLVHGISRAMRALSIRLFLVLVLAACNRDRIEKKQQPEVSKEAGGHDVQARCASDSEAWFHAHWNQQDTQTLSLSYTHHYNNSLGKCFVIVKRRYTTNKLISYSNWSLWEIYENVQHANSTRMIEEHPQPGAPHEESSVVCEVYGKRCKTSEEFDNLIRPYMND